MSKSTSNRPGRRGPDPDRGQGHGRAGQLEHPTSTHMMARPEA